MGGGSHCTLISEPKGLLVALMSRSLIDNERVCVCVCVSFRSTESLLHQRGVHSCTLPSLIAFPSAGQE